jgi:hypothetical protein
MVTLANVVETVKAFFHKSTQIESTAVLPYGPHCLLNAEVCIQTEDQSRFGCENIYKVRAILPSRKLMDGIYAADKSGFIAVKGNKCKYFAQYPSKEEVTVDEYWDTLSRCRECRNYYSVLHVYSFETGELLY